MMFRADRTEPYDRRSWRHTPVFAGDLAAPHADPSHLVFVTGVLPRGCVEVVEVERLKRAVGDFRDFDRIHAAIADGRVPAWSMPRRELSPVTRQHLDAVREQAASSNTGNEVSA